MTTLIQQRTDNDCVLASIAMALGFSKWEDAWTEEDLQQVVEQKGISDMEPWLLRHGLKQYEDWKEVHTWNEDRLTYVFLWKRRALLSVNSLNTEGGSHMVYWDGTRIYDPQEGRSGKQAVPFISSVRISRVILFTQ